MVSDPPEDDGPLTLPGSPLRLRVEADPAVVSGAPLWLAVVLHAPADGGGHNLPVPRAPGPLSVVVTPVGGTEPVATLEATPPMAGEHSAAVSLSPGQTHRELLELSGVLGELPPGAHRVQVRYHEPWTPLDAELPLQVVDATEAERAAFERLRGGRDWESALLHSTDEPDLRGVSAMAQEALRLPLFLRLAARGPYALADLDPLRLSGFTGPCEAEAAVLAYELAAAGRDRTLPTERDELLARWPGLGWRIELVDAGHGRLTQLRREHR